MGALVTTEPARGQKQHFLWFYIRGLRWSRAHKEENEDEVHETNGRASPRIRCGFIVCAYPEAVSPGT